VFFVDVRKHSDSEPSLIHESVNDFFVAETSYLCYLVNSAWSSAPAWKRLINLYKMLGGTEGQMEIKNGAGLLINLKLTWRKRTSYFFILCEIETLPVSSAPFGVNLGRTNTSPEEITALIEASKAMPRCKDPGHVFIVRGDICHINCDAYGAPAGSIHMNWRWAQRGVREKVFEHNYTVEGAKRLPDDSKGSSPSFEQFDPIQTQFLIPYCKNKLIQVSRSV
jgi:hypothetical protein